MDWFGIVKRYYDRGYYSKADVAKFVEYGKIAPEQYQEITGELYEAVV